MNRQFLFNETIQVPGSWVSSTSSSGISKVSTVFAMSIQQKERWVRREDYWKMEYLCGHVPRNKG